MGRGKPGHVQASRPNLFTLDRKFQSVNRAAYCKRQNQLAVNWTGGD
jgi:hypothetical protein